MHRSGEDSHTHTSLVVPAPHTLLFTSLGIKLETQCEHSVCV